MPVYVDDVRLKFGPMVMCHMWADTLDELLKMADRIGVERKWIQGHPKLSQPRFRNASWIHFDIALSKKKAAIAFGAVLTDRYGPIEFLERPKLKAPDEETRRIARRKLERIEAMRKRETSGIF